LHAGGASVVGQEGTGLPNRCASRPHNCLAFAFAATPNHCCRCFLLQDANLSDVLMDRAVMNEVCRHVGVAMWKRSTSHNRAWGSLRGGPLAAHMACMVCFQPNSVAFQKGVLPTHSHTLPRVLAPAPPALSGQPEECHLGACCVHTQRPGGSQCGGSRLHKRTAGQDSADGECRWGSLKLGVPRFELFGLWGVCVLAAGTNQLAARCC
jgi:hypothetical protein